MADKRPKMKVATKDLWAGQSLLYRKGEEVPEELVEKWNWGDNVVGPNTKTAKKVEAELNPALSENTGGISGRPSNAHNPDATVEHKHGRGDSEVTKINESPKSEKGK